MAGPIGGLVRSVTGSSAHMRLVVGGPGGSPYFCYLQLLPMLQHSLSYLRFPRTVTAKSYNLYRLNLTPNTSPNLLLPSPLPPAASAGEPFGKAGSYGIQVGRWGGGGDRRSK